MNPTKNMNEDLKLREKTVWTGRYKKVAFEIQNWSYDLAEDGEKKNWNYYLHLRLDYIPAENNPDAYWLPAKETGWGVGITYNEYLFPFSEMYFHGGPTHYSKICGLDGEKFRIIKVGCDYGHLHDDETDWSLELVKYDIVNTIESFLKLVPNYGPQNIKT